MSQTSDLGPIPFADEGATPKAKKVNVRPVFQSPSVRLPLWLSPDAGLDRGWWLIVILFVITVGYFWSLTLWSGFANQGVDQSGYHSMGRLMAEQQTAHWIPENPWQFISRMSILTEDGRAFAKYPPGYPLLIAVGRVIASDYGAYIINPIATAAACFMSYFLFRTVLSRATSMFGVLWMMTNPIVLLYATDANSHPTALFCTVTGFWGLLTWWQKGDYWRAWIGGLALGYTCAIRYSEALLVLPVLFAALANFRFKKRNILGGLSLILGWAVPVGVLALFCWYNFGLPWKTGYTYCNEDTGFSFRYLLEGNDPWFTPNWESLITQVNRLGLFLLWPLSLAGLIGMVVRNWRVGITIALWVVPATTLYLCYYWAPNQETQIGYLRFFISVVPGLVLAGLWVTERAALSIFHGKWTGLAMGTGFGLTVAVISIIYFWPDNVSLTGVGQIADTYWPMVLAVGFVLVCLAGAWLFEREQGFIGGPVVIMGMLTLIGCGFNIYDTAAKMDTQQANQMSYHSIQEELDRVAPKGSVIFADDAICNYIDCNGGYELYQNSMFTFRYDRGKPVAMPIYDSAKRVLEKIDRGERDFEPDPFQPERARAILNLVGELKGGELRPKTLPQIQEAQRNLIAAAWARGQRVFVLRYDSLTTVAPWLVGQKNLNENKNRVLKNNFIDLPLSVKETKETKPFAGAFQRVGFVTDMKPVGNIVVSKNGIRKHAQTVLNPAQNQQQESIRFCVVYEVLPESAKPTRPAAPPPPPQPAKSSAAAPAPAAPQNAAAAKPVAAAAPLAAVPAAIPAPAVPVAATNPATHPATQKAATTSPTTQKATTAPATQK